MIALTYLYANALVILGLITYFGTGTTSITALIPSIFGILLTISAFIASRSGKRAIGMHIAAVLALVGLLGSFRGVMKLPALLSGEEIERPVAVAAQSIMAALSIIFLYFCIRSFVDARRKKA